MKKYYVFIDDINDEEFIYTFNNLEKAIKAAMLFSGDDSWDFEDFLAFYHKYENNPHCSGMGFKNDWVISEKEYIW